ncbi:unnamed protein product [Closterium sp. NIES-53]
MAAVEGWGDPTNMPTDDGIWGADEPDETTWGETPAECDARLLAEAEQRVAKMEILDSGRLVGVEPVPAASDQESGELVLAPGEYVDVEVRVPPPNLTRYVALAFDTIHDKGSYALLVAYVDDILYVSSSTSLGDRIEADLKKSLDLTISTKVTQFLGLNVSRTSSTIHLTASNYAESLAKRFNISTDFVATPYRSTLTGHVPNLKNLSAAGLQLYQQQLGCLLFAAVTCRPDLAYVANHVAQFLRCPKE